MKVIKFGGTSVQFAHNMRLVKDIVLTYPDNELLVVLSACRGITDSLIELSEASKNGDRGEMSILINFIKSHHLQLIKELKMNDEFDAIATEKINSLIEELLLLIEGISLLRELTPHSRASVLSFGELLSTTIFATYLESIIDNVAFIDARKVMKVCENSHCGDAEFLITKDNISKVFFQNLKEGKNIQIIQGFIGYDDTGKTAVLSRGGSDCSAAVLGTALGVDEIHIWTDVSGIYTADPRYFPNAMSIKNMTYSQVKELAAFGAKVLHPDAILPAIKEQIPIRVLNTNEPGAKGTLLNSTAGDEVELDALAMLNDLHYISIDITIDKARIAELYKMISEAIASTNDKYYIISQGVSSLSLLSDSNHLEDALRSNEFEFNVKSGVSAICLSGKNLRSADSRNIMTSISKSLNSSDILLFEVLSDSALYVALGDKGEAEALYGKLHEFIISHKTKNK